uniref:Uncharacterized protein n=1 Tax=Arundo donax TaxID=35708 RepID=A0A0A8Y9S0_ARUDO
MACLSVKYSAAGV